MNGRPTTFCCDKYAPGLNLTLRAHFIILPQPHWPLTCHTDHSWIQRGSQKLWYKHQSSVWPERFSLLSFVGEGFYLWIANMSDSSVSCSWPALPTHTHALSPSFLLLCTCSIFTSVFTGPLDSLSVCYHPGLHFVSCLARQLRALSGSVSASVSLCFSFTAWSGVLKAWLSLNFAANFKI